MGAEGSKGSGSKGAVQKEPNNKLERRGTVRKQLAALTAKMTFMSQYGFITGGKEEEEEDEAEEGGGPAAAGTAHEEEQEEEEGDGDDDKVIEVSSSSEEDELIPEEERARPPPAEQLPPAAAAAAPASEAKVSPSTNPTAKKKAVSGTAVVADRSASRTLGGREKTAIDASSAVRSKRGGGDAPPKRTLGRHKGGGMLRMKWDMSDLLSRRAVPSLSDNSLPSLQEDDKTAASAEPAGAAGSGPSTPEAAAVAATTSGAAATAAATAAAAQRRQSRRGGVIKFEDAEDLQRRRKRDLVVEEIQASEKLYYKFLRILIDRFIGPLRERGLLTAAELKRMFGNLEELAPAHDQMAADLEATDEPAAVFVEYADRLRAYIPYVNGYDDACDCVAALKKNRDFQEFLEARRADPECGGLDLMSFLIMPIQRIPRYRLLLEELQKRTLPTDEEAPVLAVALEKISAICNFVNEAKRMAENKSRLVEIQHRVSGEYDNLLQPHRLLIREAPLLRKGGKLAGSKEVHVFLFSDIIMWTTPAPKYEFLGVVNLATATLSDLETRDKDKFGFVLESPALEDEGGKLVFLCRNRAHRATWVEPLTEALAHARDFLMRSRDMSQSRRTRGGARSSITMTAATIANSASSASSLAASDAAARAPVDPAPPTAAGDPVDSHRRSSIVAATERLKHLGLDQRPTQQ